MNLIQEREILIQDCSRMIMDHKFQIGYEGPDGKIVMLGDINSIEECELEVEENCVVGDLTNKTSLEFECKIPKEMGDRINRIFLCYNNERRRRGFPMMRKISLRKYCSRIKHKGKFSE